MCYISHSVHALRYTFLTSLIIFTFTRTMQPKNHKFFAHSGSVLEIFQVASGTYPTQETDYRAASRFAQNKTNYLYSNGVV